MARRRQERPPRPPPARMMATAAAACALAWLLDAAPGLRGFCDGQARGAVAGPPWLGHRPAAAGQEARLFRPARPARGGTGTEVPSPKAELLQFCEDFRSKQEEMWDMMEQEESAEKAKKKRKGKKASLLEAESFASQKTELSGELEGLRQKVVDAISRVAAGNPTPEPLRGWRGYGGAVPGECVLNGTWKLLFTDAADATFRKGKKGAATTFQEIEAKDGWFVNCVDFANPESKLKGFRVFVEGEALSGDEVQLSFRRVQLLRRSRFPRLFGEINIPLPSPKVLRNLGRLFARAKDKEEGVNPSRRGAGFTLLYVDDDLRIHQTFDGLYFVQRRLSHQISQSTLRSLR